MLKLTNISKNYTSNKDHPVEVLKQINLNIQQGEFVALLGPNGCGKTTLLEIISNLTKATNGVFSINNQNKKKPNIAMVFQDYRKSLFPWLKVKDNILFPLKLRHINKLEQKKLFSQICKNLNINTDLNQYPYQLSGGQQQMISILRGLIIEPDLYLLDEPLSSLDYQTKLFLLTKLHDIWMKKKITTIYVSHDIDEAIFLAQKIVLLSNKPTTISNIFKNPLPYPRNTKIIGSSNFATFKNKILLSYLNQL